MDDYHTRTGQINRSREPEDDFLTHKEGGVSD